MKAWSSTVSFALPVAAGVLACGGNRAAPGDYFQGKTLTIYISNSAGGGFDLNARILARHPPDHVSGYPDAVVSNNPGALGTKDDQFLAGCQKSRVDLNPRSDTSLKKTSLKWPIYKAIRARKAPNRQQ